MCLASIVMTDHIVPPIVDFSQASAETSRSEPPAERVLAGKPVHTARNFFSDGTGRFFAGIWESTPGRWRVRYAENEFCHLTRGSVRIEGADGAQWLFKEGDSFVIPAGFEGTWEVLEPLSKLYVIYEPG